MSGIMKLSHMNLTFYKNGSRLSSMGGFRSTPGELPGSKIVSYVNAI